MIFPNKLKLNREEREDFVKKMFSICNKYVVTTTMSDGVFSLKRGDKKVVLFTEKEKEGYYEYDFNKIKNFEDVNDKVLIFCEESPFNQEDLVRLFPSKMRVPGFGEWIGVKEDSQYLHAYNIYEFVKLENDIIFCKNKTGTRLREYK